MSPSTHQRICAEIQERHQRTIDDLRAKLAEAEQFIKSKRELLQTAQDELDKETDRADRAEKKLAALESQPAIGWFKYDKVSQCYHPQFDNLATRYAAEQKWVKLYAAAGAAPSGYKLVSEKQLATWGVYEYECKAILEATGAAPAQQEPVAWRAWNSQHHCYDYGESGETDSLERIVEYLCLKGEV